MIGLSQRNGPPLVPNRTVELLEQIVARLDRLEQRVEAIGALVEQAPAALAAVTDTVDEAAAQIAASGPSVDERLRAALTLADKLSRPGTVEALGRIVDRLEALEPLIGALEQLPGMAAMAVDFFDELSRGAQAAGIDLDARLKGLQALILELTRPECMAAVRSLLPILPQLQPLAKHAEALPGLVAMGVDVFDDWLRNQMCCGFDPEQMLQNMLTIGSRLTALLDSAEFRTLMDSEILSPRAVRVVGQAARALAAEPSAQDEARKLGLFGLLRALRDPDMQRSLGFAVRFARGFGRQIDDRGAPALLTAPSGD
ncbi:MAG: DUF1641 domain-containing protein [Myxococcales bacterium]|nr:DUF1641 domain-containing protein [Myxococcales bacterium]MCB9526429.1 DUF1641 domain-containing protein [Myxococcales bacterium]